MYFNEEEKNTIQRFIEIVEKAKKENYCDCVDEFEEVLQMLGIHKIDNCLYCSHYDADTGKVNCPIKNENEVFVFKDEYYCNEYY